MQILGLKKYSHGYSGCLGTDAEYVFFYFVHGRCRKYHQYAKHQFRDYDHFISVMTKFMQRSFFFRQPVTVDAIDAATLEHLAGGPGDGTFSKPGSGSRAGASPSEASSVKEPEGGTFPQ
jgi:hypothetical protein